MAEYAVYDIQARFIGNTDAMSRNIACLQVAREQRINAKFLAAIEKEKVCELEKLKSAMYHTGIAAMGNTIDYEVVVKENEDNTDYPYCLMVSLGAKPPHYTQDFKTLIDVIDNLYKSFFKQPPFEWQEVKIDG